MRQAQDGDTVRVHYTGTLQDGSIFDSSREREPLEFVLGSGEVIPGFETAISGMQVGEHKTVTIPAEEAYGPRRQELLQSVRREAFPPHLDPEVGQQLELAQPGGVLVLTVLEVSDDAVLLDANHPLAGEALTFALELVGIR